MMSSSRCGLRSASTSKIPAPEDTQPVVPSPITFTPSSSNPPRESIRIISPGSKLPGLTSPKLKLLRRKQEKLASTVSTTLQSLPNTNPTLLNALNSTLIFAQHEAGTAVCIESSGWILTCAHCFGDDEEEYEKDSKKRWLLFYNGLAVQVECRVWDGKRDLALLRVVAVESDQPAKSGEIPTFSSIPLSPTTKNLKDKVPIFCIGQPGADDLESTSARKTKYNLVEVSKGKFRGMVKGVDPQDNVEIGTLMHDAWTYWGHSGAPLVSATDGTLIGLHSSWDDETAMRHGIPNMAIEAFLRGCLPGVAGDEVSGKATSSY
ncbi:hypothetical protein G7Y89_g7581 [Cudoniella acicularis]|uniref:AT hook domain-containing protein family protein n=1 Tax=Cudoniella acicularis TaxID=354080 RepID=A0A8H4W4F3_9HELO|nr:hypothetical protein G7Y89_g7581 [Cudoniella acicularis]